MRCVWSSNLAHLLVDHAVPKNCVYELWEAFNDVAEGFGLTISEFQEILRVAIKDYSGEDQFFTLEQDKAFERRLMHYIHHSPYRAEPGEVG
jgi:hypothetical protein